jgi:outer membrane protein TolC
LKKAVAVAKQQEDLVSRQMRGGLATPLAALEAKAERLRLEAQVAEMAGK